ncbi:DUF6417 family protein [Streptomyces sp. NPDC001156]
MLALLFLEEVHDRLRLLVAVAGDGGRMCCEADRTAQEVAACIPLGELTASPGWTTDLAAAPEPRVRP